MEMCYVFNVVSTNSSVCVCVCVTDFKINICIKILHVSALKHFAIGMQ